MAVKMEKKTLLIICGIIAFFFLAVFFGLHILEPALDPVVRDMTKIFVCGAACGLLPGIWLGWKFGVAVRKEEEKGRL